jgi:hypothetical protein
VGQNDAFAETSGILAGTFRRMNNMAERPGVPLAVVHHLSRPRLLVFYHSVVVPTVARLLHRSTLVLDCSSVIVYVSTCYINMPYAFRVSGFVQLESTARLLLHDIIKRHN